MSDEKRYNIALKDRTAPVPFFLSNIYTDGIQVKLVLKTLSDHHPTARHVDLLVKAGYSEIKNVKDRKLDIFKDTRGLFYETRVNEISNENKNLIADNAQDCKIEFNPVDPGSILVAAWCKANISDDVNKVAHTATKFGAMRSSKYRMLNLTNNSCKTEEKRRHLNRGYHAAMDALSREQLCCNATSLTAYIRARNTHRESLEEELMSVDRARLRFVRLRAQQRAIRYLARQIVGRDQSAADDKTNRRMEMKAQRVPEQAEEIEARLKRRVELQKKLGHLRIRIVLFGDGTFGHGRAGPVPRKRLLKKLAQMAIVILIDEFRTSKMCCGGCGCEAVQLKGSRVLRCQSEKNIEGVVHSQNSDHSMSCPFWNIANGTPFEIDRDRNAVVNMFAIGKGILLGGGRPAHLIRKKSDKEE
jgi:hypothetical protein